MGPRSFVTFIGLLGLIMLAVGILLFVDVWLFR